MRAFEIIAGALPGSADPGVAIAASRWGASGLLDLEWASAEQAQRAIDRLARYGRGVLGVRVAARADVSSLLAALPGENSFVIFTASSSSSWPELVPALRREGRRVLCECVSEAAADKAEAAGADGIVARGTEAGGYILEETTFVLVQRLVGRALPLYAAGGIGLHTAAACNVAGCAGVVIDAALALAREARLPAAVRAAVERMEGDETICLGASLGAPFRLHRRPGTRLVDDLTRFEQDLADEANGHALTAWRSELAARVSLSDSHDAIWPIGQDASFAAPMARRYTTVAHILDAFRDAVAAHVRDAQHAKPLAENAPLARAHRTAYPILQGPMTRVSDTPEFAEAIADGGGLPFLALALLRGPQVRRLLERTRDRLASKSWGVGILGFVPPELREEQLDVIREIKPKFAIIAGGRPEQAIGLEQEGITTYLHVPSPRLLRAFVEAGARHFIFEGRECGGHVGPRTSFVLWNTMVDVLAEEIAAGAPADQLHVVFAGGIHDARSAAMAVTMAAPLAALGARVGVLIGTAYLLTPEAVASGAIVEEFQREALDCTHTVLFETAPGHAIRCAETPYFHMFRELKRQLAREGLTGDDIRDRLESLNLGRLRIASKGIAREDTPIGGPRYVQIGSDQQHVDGMYMLGQVAALCREVRPIAALHDEVSRGGTELIDAAEVATTHEGRELPPPCDVAIVGMGCVLPGARDVGSFWSNVLNKVDAITEVPRDRFDADRYYDADIKARDRIISKWGGFIGDVPFDPVKYGIPPSALPSIDPLQLLSLEVVHQALADAGLIDRERLRERTSVILGASGGLGELGLKYGVRSMLPDLLGEAPAGALEKLPEWTEDSFAGILLNVAAGRIANRFNFGGVNFTVDAACASSLAAVQLAAFELQRGTSDVVVVGGVDTVQSPFGYLCFSKSQALSPRGRCRTFDAGADGIAISEGVVALVLKRLSDAERDGDRIYAVVKAVAGSSDGRGKGLTAPRPEGQVRALRRAYAQARVRPSTVGLVEAHGTGTVAGDAAEVAALDEVFREAGAPAANCAIGSVKSMIGHTKATAGVAGLMKAALALHHRVLPPTLNVTQPNARLREDGSPFFINTDATPWVANGVPRRAGVSSFGFGGTNFHAVLEEYTGAFLEDVGAGCDQWPAELFVWAAADHRAIAQALGTLREAAERPDVPALSSLAAAITPAAETVANQAVRLAIVATSVADLRAKVAMALEAVEAGRESIADPRGVFLQTGERAGKVAFLFPGQGSQSPYMLRDLAVQFPEISDALHAFDHALDGRLPQRLSAYINPPAPFTPEEEHARAEALTDTVVAQPALGAVESGLIDLLAAFGVRPDMVAGHSYGEYVALHAAGALDRQTLATLSHTRGRVIKESVGDTPGTMAAANASADAVRAALAGRDDVWLANFNAPEQTIVSGTPRAIEQAIAALDTAGIRARRIPVACAFHSPLMHGARERFASALTSVSFSAPAVPVYSNALADVYPAEAGGIASILTDHLVSPVRFVDEIRAMHTAGARLFVEVGPKTVLTGLVRRIIDDKRSVAIALDSSDRPGIQQFLTGLGQLFACGVRISTARLFAGRRIAALDPRTLAPASASRPATWLVNGAGARPVGGAPKTPARLPEQARTAPTAEDPTRAPEPRVPLPPAPPQPEPLVPTMDDPRLVAASPSTPAPNSGAADEVMLQFQQLMSRFLETQAAIMTAYLGGNEAQSVAETPRRAEAPMSAPPPAPVPIAVAAPVSIPAPQPVAAAAPAPRTGEAVALSPAPAVPDFLDLLVRVSADRTGYTPEMLDPRLGIEADLGIDSIKRVEILSAVRRQCSEAVQERLQSAMDQFTRLKTLGQIADAMRAAAGSGEAAPAAAPAPSAPMPPSPARVDAAAALLAIVSDRTGYPIDMLDPDLNIEADLGIDSIKRVEILSAFRRQQSEQAQEQLRSVMDRLTGIKTLRELARVIDHTLAAGDASSAPRPSETRIVSNAQSPSARPARCIFRVTDARPLAEEQIAPARQGLTLVTDDGRGIADQIASRLNAAEQRAIVLREGDRVELAGGICTADWTDDAQVSDALERIRATAPIGALVHASPLAVRTALDEIDSKEWRRRVRVDIRQLYLLVRALAPDLGDAGRAGGAAIVAATMLGGDFGESGRCEISATHGGIVGFLRTAAIELADVRCRIADFDPAAADRTIADNLLAELDREGPLEIGYIAGRRVTLVPQVSGLDDVGDVPIDSNSVVLLTGGARGITAELAVALAARFKPTLVLAGRSPMPPAADDPRWTGRDGDALKNAIAADMRQRNSSVRPVDVDAACRAVLAAREIRQTLASCLQAGARAEYRQVDVRDPQPFGALIDDVYRTWGRLDVVVHGAGVIEDKLIADKTPESFDRVVHTKADSVFTLARTLRPEGLRALVLMSSVTAAFGNRGQADYGAANGIYNASAQILAQQWPSTRVVAVNWGPWDKRGMASEEVRKQFLTRGIVPIDPAAGVRALIDEIACGTKADAVVVIGDGPWAAQATPQQALEVIA